MVCEQRWVYTLQEGRGGGCPWAGRRMLPEYSISIYGLRAPGEREYRYVGSAEWPPERLRDHWLDRGQASQKGQWLADLEARGMTPEMVILEMTPPARRDEREFRWMRFLIGEGHRITNRFLK
jgi:hypothetical protein